MVSRLPIFENTGYGHSIAPRWVLGNRHSNSSRKGLGANSPQIHLWERMPNRIKIPVPNGTIWNSLQPLFACQQPVFQLSLRDNIFGWFSIYPYLKIWAIGMHRSAMGIFLSRWFFFWFNLRNSFFRIRQDRNDTRSRKRPARDKVPLAHKFICGKQCPTESKFPFRMGRDEINYNHYLHAYNPFVNCPYGTKFLGMERHFTHIWKYVL